MKGHDLLKFSLSLWLYEGFWWLLALVLEWYARNKPKLWAQVEGRRQLDQVVLKSWRRDSYSRSALFFASSAGEYEQAKPLARRLHQKGFFVVFVFASVSGIQFARAQGETLPFLKAPWDSPRLWRQLLLILRPDTFFVVRYELWPGFLSLAQRCGPVYLIDAVVSQGLDRKFAARWLWGRMLQKVSRVFAVSELDRAFYIERLLVHSKKVRAVGDTKYDRVLERIEERQEQARSLEAALADFRKGARILVVGSAWEADLAALLSVYPEIVRVEPRLKLIVAPHDIGASNADRMQELLEKAGLRVCRTSQRALDQAGFEDNALLVDKLGLLPELYALSHLAWVGGGMHYRVHNVLEPACRGIYICFGPRYHTSQEALWLVKQGLAQVIRDGSEFLSWFRQLNWAGQPPNHALWLAVGQQKGASERILRDIEEGIR